MAMSDEIENIVAEAEATAAAATTAGGCGTETAEPLNSIGDKYTTIENRGFLVNLVSSAESAHWPSYAGGCSRPARIGK